MYLSSIYLMMIVISSSRKLVSKYLHHFIFCLNFKILIIKMAYTKCKVEISQFWNPANIY